MKATRALKIRKPDKIMEDHKIEPDDRPRLDEGFNVEKMFTDTDQKVKVGDRLFLLPQAWLTQWHKYCFIDLIKLEEGNHEAGPRTPPGKIDYSDIFEDPFNSVATPDEPQMTASFLSETDPQLTWQNHHLKR